MGAPRIYPPEVSDARRREQRRRFNMRDRRILELIRHRHPRIYRDALIEADNLVNQQEGLLPGDKEHK